MPIPEPGMTHIFQSISVSSAYKVALSLNGNSACVHGGPSNTQNADYFGKLFSNYTSQARFDPSHGEPVEMSCQQKPIFVAETLLPTQHVKHADLM